MALCNNKLTQNLAKLNKPMETALAGVAPAGLEPALTHTVLRSRMQLRRCAYITALGAVKPSGIHMRLGKNVT